MRQRLTERYVEALRPESKQLLVWDEALPGFGVSVSIGGTKSYICQGVVNDKNRRVTIGRCDLWRLSDARRQAAQKLLEMNVGIDPKARPAVSTWGDVWNQWESIKAASLRPATQRLYRAMWHNHLEAGWANKAILATTAQDVVTMHREVHQRVADKTGNGGSTANQCVVCLKMLRALADDLDVEMPPRDVFRIMNRQKLWAPEPPRTNVITLDQMRDLWQRLQSEPLHPGYGVSRLILLTGRRYSEASMLRWDEVSMGNQPAINIPPERVKTKVRIQLPLPTAILPTLRSMEMLKRNEFVFPSLHKPGRAFSSVDALLERVWGSRLSPHTLRRSWSSVAALHIPEPARKRLMAHHNSTDITMSTYTVLSAEDLRPYTDQMADLIAV